MTRAKPKQTRAGEVAQEYCKRFPRTATKTVANKAFKDHPRCFRDAEHARNLCRYYRGEGGERDRNRAKKANSVVECDKRASLFIPPSDARPIEPYVFTQAGKGIIAGDMHMPYHDCGALQAVLNRAVDKGFTDWIILNGDVIDAYQISHWIRDPEARRFSEELEMLKAFLRALKATFGTVVYKLGNHENRWRNYMRVKAPELIGIEALTFAKLIDAEGIGVTLVDSPQVIHMSVLTILHGHEYGRALSAPVNPARGAYLRTHACAVVGHHHQTSHHAEPDVRGNLTSCWSHGCLADLHPEYRPLNKWDHSCLFVEFDGDQFSVQICKYIHGRAY